MRVVNQISFNAKDDADALRIASERLGRDAVILSTQLVKEGGVFGLFQKSVLKVTAGLLEDDSTPPAPKKNINNSSSMDDNTRRENLIAFQKLMEFKERSDKQKSIKPAPLGNEGYSNDIVNISRNSLQNSYNISPAPTINNNIPYQDIKPQQLPQPNTFNTPNAPVQPQNDNLNNINENISKQFNNLADKIDALLQRVIDIENKQSTPSNFNSINIVPENSSPDNPEKSFIEQRLKASGVDEKYIAKLLADYFIFKNNNNKASFLSFLSDKISCSPDIGGRKIMLIGPTGVGKTTTIAKLAAIKALWEHKKVLLLTSDTYRIAAVEQLKTYAKILGIPLEIIFDFNAIPAIIEQYNSYDIILLDTAGRSQRDKDNLKIFENLYNSFSPDAVHLVLAANMKYEDMLDVVEHIPAIPISHLLFTKLDETVSYGSIFNIHMVVGSPISFLTTGQNVPKDIENATGSKLAAFLLKSDNERKK